MSKPKTLRGQVRGLSAGAQMHRLVDEQGWTLRQAAAYLDIGCETGRKSLYQFRRYLTERIERGIGAVGAPGIGAEPVE